MRNWKKLSCLSFGAALSVAGFVFAQGMAGMPGMNMPAASAPASQPTSKPATQATTQAAVDVKNTVCPVSGDKVGDSKLTETFEGKIYHLCCSDCPPEFKKDPAKYAKAVAADPAKYGIAPTTKP